MKRISLLLLSFVLLGPLVSAAPLTPLPLEAKDARTMGMGGAFIALSSGYQSLFGNPAGFGLGRGMLTLANVNAWAYMKPTPENIDKVMALDPKNTAAIIELANGLIVDNGLGVGVSAGIGFTGGGLGLGATLVSDQVLSGKTFAGITFRSATQLNVTAGMAVGFGSKEFGLKIGGDIRPFVRIDSELPLTTALIASLMGSVDDMSALTKLLLSQNASYGAGLAADLGLIATFGPLSVGLSVRDLSTPFRFSPTTLGTAYTFGTKTASTDPMAGFDPAISVGLGYTPVMLPGLFDPAIYFELKDPVTAITNADSFWNLVHVGAEVRLISLIYVRGGLNEGWLSVGAGVDLLILQGDIAYFTEELGTHPGDSGRTGISANIRLHL